MHAGGQTVWLVQWFLYAKIWAKATNGYSILFTVSGCWYTKHFFADDSVQV
jgi:hypothetical protein